MIYYFSGIVKPEDSLSKAAEAASRVNALLIAKGKLKPSQLGGAVKKKVCNHYSLGNGMS